MNRYSVRMATPADAELIAQAFIMAVGGIDVAKSYCGDNAIDVLKEIALTEGSQYYYANAIVAQCNNTPIGIAIGYDGAKLLQLREQTFNVICKHVGTKPDIEPETSEGEFYVDTLAVLSQYRGRGVGKILLDAICNRAFADGHTEVGLLVDMQNPKAESLYARVGFVRRTQKSFLGHPMWHMTRRKGCI